MDKSEMLTLIKDEFLPDEAKEVFTNIISAKIKFYQIKNFSSQVRSEKCDEIAKKKIPELKMEMERLKEILQIAKAQNKKLEISSEIKISLSDYTAQ